MQLFSVITSYQNSANSRAEIWSGEGLLFAGNYELQTAASCFTRS